MPNLKREISTNDEVATLAVLVAVAVDSGLSLSAAIEAAISDARGSIANRLRRLVRALDLGGNLADELALMQAGAGGALAEFLVKLQIAIEFGSPVANQLMQFSNSLRGTINHLRLTMGARQENTMLLPLVFLILPVSILFALYPSLQYLSLTK
jgi:tight adherence protein C